jgi:cytochrome c553
MISWLLRNVVLLLFLLVCMSAQATPPFEDNMAQRVRACTVCHGDQGRAGPDGYYPRLAGKPAAYLYQQLLNFRSGRRHYAPMAALLTNLDDAYLQALADYFSAQSVPYPAPKPTSLNAAEKEAGRKLVTQGNEAQRVPACTQCHGLKLTGVNPATPGLLGLPVDYINAQLGSWRTGRRSSATPDCMATVAKRLTAADVNAAARWLSSQSVPLQAHAADHRPAPSQATVDLKCADLAQSQAVLALQEPQGAYLARLGNCAHCHTARGGPPYAGGRAVDTPFGEVFSSNITSDPVYGIGAWSADDFWRALHHGEAKDGRLLYPAFPYTSYTRISRADADVLFAFLKTVPPQPRVNQAHALRWPFSTQIALRAWRTLFFSPASTAPVGASLVPPGTLALQRGAYLVEGLGHCLECHGARNALGALSGAPVGSVLPASQWFAPSLNDTAQASVATWSVEEIARFLQTGLNGQAQAQGPMAEVVQHGTQYLTDSDAQAMAQYLKALPQTTSKVARNDAARTGLSAGAKLYETHCADCHGLQGQGRVNAYPALAGNRAVLLDNANNLIHSVLNGGFAAATAGNSRPFGMPPFLLQLNDGEIAAVLTYVRNAWGNQAGALTEFDINKLRRSQAP